MWALVAALFFLQTPDYSAEGTKALDAAKYGQAAELFGKAVAADPKDYAAHFHLALSYTMLKRDAESLAEYKKVLELKPGLYEAELNAGILLIRDKQPAEAAQYLQQAVEQKPKEFRPRILLGRRSAGIRRPGQSQRAIPCRARTRPEIRRR